ncbi:MAG: hypothetical protein H3C47_10185 [Candidatus Cloacimonetes bacterium]|nr:hypothetical protein [Candidatus Cloacimonadota bacterium]
MKLYSSLVLILIVCGLGLYGCSASNGSVFDDKNSGTNSQNQSTPATFSFSFRDSAFPQNTGMGTELQESELPSDAIYLALSSVSLGANVFQLDIRIKDLDTGSNQIYDLPLLLRYNRNVLRIVDSSDNNISLIEGTENVRLRAYLDPQFAILVGRNDENFLNNFSGCNNFCGYYMIGHSLTREVQPRRIYRGTLLSVIVNVLVPGSLETPIGFELSQSSALNIEGNPISVRFFGGVLRRL